jgi:periplasmic copper chaperone A
VGAACRRFVALGVTGVFGVLLGVASPAAAHIDPEPPAAQAGARLEVGFTVEHGCDGSPTVQLDMRLPEGVNDPEPAAPSGWSASIDGDVVTFVGGPLPDDQPLTFPITVTLPPTDGATIFFPFVQRCEVGEIRWIEVPTDGSGATLDEPAPAMKLFGPVIAPAAVTTTTAASVNSEPPSTAPTTVSTTVDTSVSTTSSTQTAGGSNVAAAVIIGIAAAILAGVIVVVRRRPT